MAQFGRPVTPDVATNGWSPSTGTTLWGCIDEASYSDTDYISDNAVSYCEVTLTTSLSDPVSSSAHYVRYRLGRTRTDRTLTVVVRLMQGGTEIASWEHIDPGASFQPFEQTLTTGQADAITDYTDLRLRFDITSLQNAQVYCQVSWAELEIPDAGVQPTTVNVNAASVTASASVETTIPGTRTVSINNASAISTPQATIASETFDVSVGVSSATTSAQGVTVDAPVGGTNVPLGAALITATAQVETSVPGSVSPTVGWPRFC